MPSRKSDTAPSIKDADDARITEAINWRADLELQLAEMINTLEEAVREMPISLEKVQVSSALKALERAQKTCAAMIAHGQELLRAFS